MCGNFGEYWVFAHNGDLINFYPKLSGCYLPVGDTDSELAFCAIMETLKSGFSRKAGFVSGSTRCFAARRGESPAMAVSISYRTVSSCLLICSSDSTTRFDHTCFPEAQLKDLDMTVDFRTPDQRKRQRAVIATQPLTVNEAWTKIAAGECCLFSEGKILAKSAASC